MKIDLPFKELLRSDDFDIALKLFERKTHKKGDFLLKYGNTCKHLFFIEKGLVYSETIDGNILWYEFEGNSFTNIESFYNRLPSNSNILVAEDNTIVLRITYDNFNSLINSTDSLKTWAVKFYQNELSRITSYYESLRTKDATERYNELINSYPEILQRIPLGHIASYLGITQVSLSRIRAGNQKQAK